MSDDEVIDELRGTVTIAGMHGARIAQQLMQWAADRRRQAAQETSRRGAELSQRYEAQTRQAESYFGRAARPEFLRDEPEHVVGAWRAGQEWERLEPQRFAGLTRTLEDGYRSEHGEDIAAVAERLAAAEPRVQQTGPEADQTRETEQEANERAGDPQMTRDEREPTVVEAADREGDTAHAADVDQDATRRVAADEVAYDSAQARASRDEQIDAVDAEKLPADAKLALKTVDRANAQDPRRAASKSAGRRSSRRARRTGRGVERQRERGMER